MPLSHLCSCPYKIQSNSEDLFSCKGAIVSLSGYSANNDMIMKLHMFTQHICIDNDNKYSLSSTCSLRTAGNCSSSLIQ